VPPRRVPLLLVWLLIFPSLASTGARCGWPGPQPSATAGAVTLEPRVWERFETAGSVWADWDNPFDPAQVRLDGEFRAPDGSLLVMPGFFTRHFRRSLAGGYERIEGRGQTHWRVRMTPTQPGTWEWRWVVTAPSGSFATEWEPFDVAPAAPGRHGFLRRSPLDGRYLRWDDGTPYVAIGENLAWYDGRGTFAYDDWMAKLAARGVNYVRLWMPSWAFGLEWLERAPDGSVASTSLGDYTDRLDRAWQLDYVMELAARHGIAVMLCIQNHGPFSLEANSEWADNPYNAANGGPLAQPADFFSDATARALFQRRLRYLVARWGYATNLLAWELWNEVDLVGQGDAVEAWHAEMGDALGALDPYDHLVSTSLSRSVLASYWELPQIDFTQIHHYQFPLPLDMPTVLHSRLRAYANAYPGEPRLVSEYGVDYRGPAETIEADPEGTGFHQGLWVGLLGGGFGTGMSWWWDNVVDPLDLYFHFAPIARLVAGIAFDAQRFAAIRPPIAADGRNLMAYVLRGDGAVLGWIQNVDHQWYFDPLLLGPDLRPVEGATLALDGLADGAWTARWIDAYTGEDVAALPVAVSGGTVTLDVPTFTRDVALRMER
jgi:hypothetical protein